MLDGTGDGSTGWGSRLGSCEPPPHGLEYSRWHFLFPRETELGRQGLWLWLLGDAKSAGVQAKTEKRQPQQRQLSGVR